jgi:hypothetical protein
MLFRKKIMNSIIEIKGEDEFNMHFNKKFCFFFVKSKLEAN